MAALAETAAALAAAATLRRIPALAAVVQAFSRPVLIQAAAADLLHL